MEATLDCDDNNCSSNKNDFDPLFLLELLHRFDTKPALTDDELHWCEEIKQAVAAQDDVKEISDFEIAQMALAVPQGDIENALFRIKGLQDFREEYSINDTVEEGIELLKGLLEQMPGLILDVAYLPLHEVPSNDHNSSVVIVGGHFTIVLDYACMKPNVVRLPGEWRTLLGGVYYEYQLLHANIRCIREGVGQVVETQGMTLECFSVDMIRQCWYHMLEFYPLKLKSIFYMHASIVGNMVHSLCKSLMGAEIGDSIRVGVDLGYSDSTTRLSELFQMPTPEMAQAKLLSTLHAYLLVRYQNQMEFRLPPQVVVPPINAP